MSDSPQHFKWVFTYNTSDDVIEISKVYEFLSQAFLSNDSIRDATFQLEQGSETNRQHLQGRIHFLKKKTKAGVLNLFSTIFVNYCSDEQINNGVNVRMLLQVSVSPEMDASASIAYCSKDDTRLPGTVPFHKLKKAPVYTGADVACLDVGLRPWQEQLMTILRTKPYNQRHIHWIVDLEGASGKSLFLKWLQWKGEFEIGEVCDAGNATQLKATSYNLGPKSVYFVDLPRVRTDSLGDIMRCLEQLKNGKLLTVQYGGGQTILFDPPLLVVFSNYYPKLEWLSADRWKIFEMTKDYKLRSFVAKKAKKSIIQTGRDLGY